jgi:hypothetical protein
VLIEAAKLVRRQSYELALVHEKEMQKGNRNRVMGHLLVSQFWPVKTNTQLVPRPQKLIQNMLWKTIFAAALGPAVTLKRWPGSE